MGIQDHMQETYGTHTFQLGVWTGGCYAGQEAVMPMEYILPSLRIAQITGMTDTDTVKARLA